MKESTKKLLFTSFTMASNARCISILLVALTLSFQTHARDSKFLTKEPISVSPTQAPTLAPSPSPQPEIVEHGYGLYGQDMYENNEHPTTTTTTKSTPQSNSMEFEKAYTNKFNGNNEYVSEKQGMSDTRFLENGKYFYDVNYEKEQNARFNANNNENMNKNFEEEKQGLSDSRFLENGKYFYDVNNEEKEANKEQNFDEFEVNNNENENENENEKYYNAYNENENNNYNSNNNNNDYVNRYNGNDINEYETQGRDGYNYQHNEYHAKEGRGVYNYPKKFPKYEYDTMEEYNREQGQH